jgi:hypothetical protein
VRKHLTTFRWYEDRLCSLPSRYLVCLSLSCFIGLGLLAYVAYQLGDDVPLLVSESDFKTAFALFDILLLTTAALWLLSCTLGALWRRFLLRRRGL